MDRRAIAISGIVQGVGFRPYVFGLASDLRLHGFVKNSAGGVLIEVEGETLVSRPISVHTHHPATAARSHPTTRLTWSSKASQGDLSFCIEPSRLY